MSDKLKIITTFLLVVTFGVTVYNIGSDVYYTKKYLPFNLQNTNSFLSLLHSILAYNSINYKFYNKDKIQIKDITKCLPQNQVYDYKILKYFDCNDKVLPEWENKITREEINDRTCNDTLEPPINCSISSNDYNLYDKIAYMNLQDLLGLFFTVTSIFHLIYATDINGVYSNIIKIKNNWLRWIEYSITATIMILVISRLSGVTDKQTLDLIKIIMVSVMIQGQLTEMCLILYRNAVNNNDTDLQNTLKRLIIYFQIIGYVLMFSVFKTILDKWNGTLKRLEVLFSNRNDTPRPKIFDYINILIYSEMLLFSSFGFIQIYQIYDTFKNYDKNNTDENKGEIKYENFEYMYNFLSLISKAGLGYILFYGVVQGIENGQCSCENNGGEGGETFI
jgi:hypothetical protein